MWFKRKTSKTKRRKKNYKRDTRKPIFMVNARMVEKKKARTRKIGALVLFGAVFAGLCWLSMAGIAFMGRRLFSENDRFLIRYLEIRNPNGRLKADQVKSYVRYAGIPLSEESNLFAEDIRGIQHALENVALIKQAAVRRQLPDTLLIDIVERVAVARLGSEGDEYYFETDHEGYVLPSSFSDQLTTITGHRRAGLRPGDAIGDASFHDALQLLDYCETLRLKQPLKIARIDVRRPDYLDVILKSGQRVFLSRRALEENVDRLVRILQKNHELGLNRKFIDLTVANNVPAR